MLVLTDTQFAVLVSAIVAAAGGLGTTIKWAVGRVVRALDTNSEAMLANAEKATALATKIDRVDSWLDQHTPPLGSQMYVSPPPAPLTPPPPPRRAPSVVTDSDDDYQPPRPTITRTPARGIPITAYGPKKPRSGE